MLDKKNFIIIITTLFIKLIASLHHTDFCYTSDTECVGYYSAKNFYETKCVNKCPKNYGYKCDDEFCSVNKDKCIKYKKRSNILIGYFHINFRNNVKKCHIDSFRLKPNDFCLNTNTNCLENHYVWTGKNLKVIKKKVNCPCLNGNNSFVCGQDFCTLNSKVCSALNLIQPDDLKREAIEIGIQKCQNDDLIMPKYFYYV
jgi:hypothetical protein